MQRLICFISLYCFGADDDLHLDVWPGFRGIGAVISDWLQRLFLQNYNAIDII